MNIVLFATAWGAAEGGVNAFNHDFAIGLRAALPRQARLFVTCAATPSPPTAPAGIELLPLPIPPGAPLDPAAGAAVRAALPAGVRVDLWVGHDVVTGFAARQAWQDQRGQDQGGQDQGGTLALIHHMAYHSYKNIAGGQGAATMRRHQAQAALFATPGARCFGVGTDLAHFASILASSEAVALVPGFPEGLGANRSGIRDLRVVIAGRFGADDEPLKQGRLAAQALGRAIQHAEGRFAALQTPSLLAFGLDPDDVARGEFEALVNQAAGRVVAVVPTHFSPDPTPVRAEMTRANLVLMPSLREGFGLVGWEAIGCGTPLILGKHSGLYRSIHDWLGGVGDGLLYGVDLRGEPGGDADVTALSEAILDIAADIPAAKARALDLRQRLQARLGCTWRGMADAFLSALGEGRAVPPRAVAQPVRGQKEAEAVVDIVPEMIALRRQIKRSAQVSELQILLAIPSQQWPPDTLAIEDRLSKIFEWAFAEQRLEDLRRCLLAVLRQDGR